GSACHPIRSLDLIMSRGPDQPSASPTVFPHPLTRITLENPVAYLSADVRRRQIIDAAIEVIATEGLARATTRRIAERADATLGSLNHCFRGKDELMRLVLERGIAT